MTKLKDLNKIQIHLKDYLWDICCTIMSIDTVKRFDRIVAILVKLQSKRIVKAQELFLLKKHIGKIVLTINT